MVQAKPKPSYRGGCWLFLRLLGVVYLIAFVSLWVQIDGLVGSEGILPVGDYLERIAENTGGERYWKVPSLLWLGHADAALHTLCAAGVLLSLLLIVGVAPIAMLFVAWVTYLSLVCGGQTFLSFQWDILLLETGFCALFVAPSAWRPQFPWSAWQPRRTGLWLLWLLLFKLMFLSGVVKLLSMDESWWKLTALDFHYYTQPIPAWTSWYTHRLPGWVQKLSILLTYVIEIGFPFLIFVPRWGRRMVGLATVFLMLMIAATGNYGFFNLLSAVLCIPLLDDALWCRLLPRRVAAWVGRRTRHQGSSIPARRIVPAVLAVALICISALTFVREMVRTAPPDGIGGLTGKLLDGADRWILTWGRPYVLDWTGPFRTINGYGLFRSMTVARPEIVVEGSRDGSTWVEYEFKWKAGDPARRPEFVAPHMPRVDWQMWFAALNPRRAAPWLDGLMRRLLEGSPAVLGLLDENPFPDGPPRYVRLVYYRYEFSSAEQKREQGLWWVREQTGMLTRPISLAQLQ